MQQGRRWAGSALAIGLSVVVFGQGCLSSSYEVSRRELDRLASLPAEERASRVRVVQQTTLEDDIHEDAQGGFLWGSWDETCCEPESEHEEDDDDAGPAAVAAAVAVAVVAVAGSVAVTAAASEGARYDGWVATEVGQPVLLIEQDGDRRWSSLGELDSADLSEVAYGVLPDGGFDYLGRRPLDRRGVSYQFELGSAVVGSSNDPAWGYAARVALGYMPSQYFGVSVGWSPSVLERSGQLRDAGLDELTFESRAFVQAELWPLALGRLHAGVYGEVGYGWVLRDEPLGSRSTEGWSTGAGLALQLDWTTRLALTLRGGLAFVPHLEAGFGPAAESRRIAPAVTLGVSVY